MHSASPLRYPGGKYSIRYIVADIVARNGPITNFAEPFAGGAGLSLWLLENKYVENIYLNDKDKHIYAFWYSILNDTQRFMKVIDDIPVSLEEWDIQKHIINEHDTTDEKLFGMGFATFFINRCSRSGMITKSVGPIGGRSQNGEWKIDARFNKKRLIEKVERISKMRNNIFIYNLDAIDFMTELNVDESITLFYLDPPYYVQGSSLYREYYVNGHHDGLKHFLYTTNSMKWIMSYDNADYIRKLYKEFNIIEIELLHQAHKKKKEKELIIIPPTINIK